MDSISKQEGTIYIEIEDDKNAIASTSAYFQQLAIGKGMEASQALHLRFALEDLFNFIFSFLIIQDKEMKRIKIWASFDQNAIDIVIQECGIPILADEIPDIAVEDFFDNDFQYPTFLDRQGTVYNGFGIHFIKEMIDELSISHTSRQKYYEICIRQYFSQPTNKISPIFPVATEFSDQLFSVKEEIKLDDNYTLKRLDSLNEAIQVVRGLVETFGYSMYEYNRITDINDYLSLIGTGCYFPYVVVKENNIVVQYFAYHQCSYNPRYVEHCHMFARPCFRGEINPMKIMRASDNLPLNDNYDGIYALCVSMHIISQLGALRNNHHVTGFRFFNLHVQLRSVHRDSPDFFCLVEFHKVTRSHYRELYIPKKYEQFIVSIYTDLQQPFTLKDSEGSLGSEEESEFIVEMDSAICRSLIFLHPKVADWNTIRREVAHARIKGIKVLRISISAEQPDCMELANRMGELDFIFTGVTPINDLLVFHYFNGMDIDFSQIRLVHDVGRPLLDYIEAEYHKIFPL